MGIKTVSRFGLPCSSLYSVKQQTTVISTDRLCLSNGNAESHIEPQDRERKRGKVRERERASAGGKWRLRDLNRGSIGFSESVYKDTGTGEKKRFLFIRSVCMTPTWQSPGTVSARGYLILPVFEDMGLANLTNMIVCHHTLGAISNLYKAGHPHSQTHLYICTHAKTSICRC